MSDPFTFDLSRLRIRAVPRDDGRAQVQWAYLLPAGGELTRDLFQQAFFVGGGGGSSGQAPEHPFGLPLEAKPLFDAFRRHVAGLSAHQRLAWMAAAQKEAADV